MGIRSRWSRRRIGHGRPRHATKSRLQPLPHVVPRKSGRQSHQARPNCTHVDSNGTPALQKGAECISAVPEESGDCRVSAHPNLASGRKPCMARITFACSFPALLGRALGSNPDTSDLAQRPPRARIGKLNRRVSQVTGAAVGPALRLPAIKPLRWLPL